MSSFSLDDLLRGIAAAVKDANRELNEAARQHVEHSFTASDGVLKPRTSAFLLPRDHLEPGDAPYAVHHVPHAALVHHRPLGIDALTVDLECTIEGVVQMDGKGPPQVQLRVAADGSAGASGSRLTIQFKANDPPEGIARLNDKLLRTF